jgi:DNA mismatch repair protein MutS2
MLSNLETDRNSVVRDLDEARALREEAEKLRADWQERTRSSLNDLIEKTRQKLRRTLEQAQDEIRSTVKRLEEARTRTQVQQEREAINSSFRAAGEAIDNLLAEQAPELRPVSARTSERPPSASPDHPPKLVPGIKVRVAKFKTIGTLMDLIGGKAKVALGNLQMLLPLEDIEPISERALPPEFRRNEAAARRRIEDSRPPAPPQTLDLRGHRFDDGMSALERWIDQAYRSGAWKEVTVVHGFGTGALREGTRKLLATLPYIKEYRDAGQSRGGTGATLIEFDS